MHFPSRVSSLDPNYQRPALGGRGGIDLPLLGWPFALKKVPP